MKCREVKQITFICSGVKIIVVYFLKGAAPTLVCRY